MRAEKSFSPALQIPAIAQTFVRLLYTCIPTSDQEFFVTHNDIQAITGADIQDSKAAPAAPSVSSEIGATTVTLPSPPSERTWER